MTRVAQLLAEKQLIVCCGAGGVGKTSVAAALGLAGAQQGRRVLVITIDPSRRLAEVLGVSRNAPAPIQLSPTAAHHGSDAAPERLLSAWMLEPKVVADRMVRDVKGGLSAAEPFLRNRLYHHVTSMVAGMQEYTAICALHQFIDQNSYDLIILDTPPTKNALQFLDAPQRIARFLDSRVLRFFLPGTAGPFRRAAQRVLQRILDSAFGSESRKEFQAFIELFVDVLETANRSSSAMAQLFTQDTVAFLLVTSPAAESLAEAFRFEERTRAALGIPWAGYLLNRSLAAADDTLSLPEALLEPEQPALIQSALHKLARLANEEQSLIETHRAVYADLASRAGPTMLTLALPYLPEGVTDRSSLEQLAAVFAEK